MVFSSLEFIFRFLPVFLIVYYIVPVYWKNAALLLGSIAFYAFGEPIYVFLIIGSVLLNYLLASVIGKSRGTAKRRLFLVVDIIFNTGLLAVFKYSAFIVENINLLSGARLEVP
ncbi:MAG: hypothetical protein J5966_04475 [Lachnospiraceae bacterium]|nr:hypothetical protein [Lachnospiraceae bacterium]